MTQNTFKKKSGRILKGKTSGDVSDGAILVGAGWWTAAPPDTLGFMSIRAPAGGSLDKL